MKNESCTCPECGHKLTSYTFNFNKGLASCMIKMAKFDEAFLMSGVSVSALELTTSQYVNFQKLRYWNLIEKVQGVAHNKGGWWRFTIEGRLFLEGKNIYNKVVMRKNKFVNFAGIVITLRDVEEGYQYRPEFARQKAYTSEYPAPLVFSTVNHP